ncbi:MAG TPA: translocation/assembly module TamB domain-containing protein, partial [Bacteroidales bacterium]|nr:translocation/assembly module TamB domain-containing protein [Bacteroidales bacterium]
KARYTINGQTKLHENGLVFVNTSITDRYGSKGVINGGITYTHLRNLGFNTTIHFSNIELINLTESDNSTFYGKAFGNGYFNLRGNLKKIFMELSAQSNKNTEIHIPLSNGTEAVNSNLLKFVQNTSFTADKITIHQTQEKKEKPASTELEVQLKLNITPDAAMLIEIDKSAGDVIKGFGSGLISMDIKPSKHIFNIQGDYLIESGSYKFVLQGIFNRDFIIQQGGTIGFNGDINKTTLNLTAKYRTKTSINTLISDTSSVSNRRTVDCLIKLTGPLMNPNIAFDIEIPDLDPITKARVDAALNTEDKVIKQVMSLLVSNSFIPDIQSSVVNNSTLLYSNATEVLSNQINKIFNQLDIPLDLSFNYQPGQNGRDIFDAAVSTQLFNNRVIINGNIGNARYSNSTNEVVGDVDVEIKLDEKGKFRAKLFSHSADQFSNYLDNSQRNGGGFVYQEEFTTFKELLKSIFGNKKKRKAENKANNIKE